MKKIIASFTMVAFIIFSLSCYSTKNIKLDADAAQKEIKGEILRVVMTSGEIIEFSKGQPGRVYNESIEGKAVRVTGELDKAFIKGTEMDKKGKILRIIVSIPLSKVEMIGAKEDKTLAALVVTIVVVGLGLAIWVGQSLSGPDT